MKGDFTRGFEPDRERGKRYRRVLLQQGRVLLDSDHAALVDATDRSLRELAEDLGCAAGSPDDGFLTTPGTLHRRFDQVAGISDDGNLSWHRDYLHRYLERWPSLAIEGTGPAGTLTIALAAPHPGGSLVLWLRQAGPGPTPTTITARAGATSVPVAVASDEFARYVVSLPATDTLELLLDPGERVWLGLIEGNSVAAEPASFSVAAGRYYLGGMVLENPAPAPWPAQAYPPVSGSSDQQISDLITGPTPAIVTFVEGWERLITHHHDRGIREQALGGELDTTVRSQLLGQVKVAPFELPASDASFVPGAVANPVRADGTLVVDTAAAIVDPDPCAVPVDGGYTGRDNRLYRFEVHEGGAIGDVRIKWSRNNGSDLWPVLEVAGSEVTVPSGSELRDGDLVEVLSEAVELGDLRDAAFVGTSFVPPTRLVGQLAVLVELEPDGLGRPVFRLGQLADPSLALSLDPARYGDLGQDTTLLRRWDGLLDSDGGTTEHEVEDGITLTLGGTSFDPGDYWSWQARVLTANETSWQATAHGPERRFAALALFELPATSSEPLVLVGLADDRFTSLCALEADDIDYDGDSVCSSAGTVQEALDELYRRTGCCELKFGPCHPSAIADDVLLAELIASELSSGDVLCLAAGTYTFSATLTLPENSELTIRGCPGTVITAAPGMSDPLFLVPNDATLTLESLSLHSNEGAASSLIELNGSSRLRARDLRAAAIGSNTAAISDGAGFIAPDPDTLADPQPWPTAPVLPGGARHIELRDCTVLAGLGLRCGLLGRVELTNCGLRTRSAGLSATTIGELELRDCVLSCSLTSAEVPSAEQLRTRPAASEALARELDGATTGVGLSVRTILAGQLRGTAVVADIGLFADALWHGEIASNTVRAGQLGIAVNQLLRARIRDNTVRSSGDGIRVEFAARMASICGNRVRVEGSGLTLAANASSEPRTLEQLNIEGNLLEATSSGLRLGSSVSGVCRALHIANNTIADNGSDGAALVRLFHFAALSDGPGLSFVANHVHVRSGNRNAIELSGPSIAVIDCRLRMLEEGIAVFAQSCPHLIVRGNTIEFNEAEAATGGIFAIDTPRAEIVDNHLFQADEAGTPMRSLEVQGSAEIQGVTVTGNRFEAGLSIVFGIGGLRFADNVLAGSIEIAEVFGGDISNNTVNGTHSFEGGDPIESLLIREAPFESQWRVCDNRAPQGAIRLMPARQDEQQEVPFEALVTDNQARTVQVGWIGDFDTPSFDTSVFEQDVVGRDQNTRVIVTENMCRQRMLVNDYFNSAIISHNLAQQFFWNHGSTFSTVSNPNVVG